MMEKNENEYTRRDEKKQTNEITTTLQKKHTRNNWRMLQTRSVMYVRTYVP